MIENFIKTLEILKSKHESKTDSKSIQAIQIYNSTIKKLKGEVK